MKVLITKLDSLLLLESVKLYHSSWNELKIKVMQLAAEWMINIDNQHITKLTQVIEILVINQKKLISAALIFYAVALKDMSVWSNLSIIYKVSTCLIRELMITYSDVFLQDWKHLIKQIMKEINKLKDNTVSEKVLTVWRLLNNNILIIINTVEIKK